MLCLCRQQEWFRSGSHTAHGSYDPIALALALTLALTLTLTLTLPNARPWEWRTLGMADPGSGEPVPILQPVPISCHIRGCKAPLSSIVSGAISKIIKKKTKLNFHIYYIYLLYFKWATFYLYLSRKICVLLTFFRENNPNPISMLNLVTGLFADVPIRW